MIWLTWRRLRAQALVLYGVIAVFAVVLAVTGPQVAHRSETAGDDFLAEMSGLHTTLYVLGVLAVLAVPFVIGMFWGAPLVTRELDTGTYQLVWTQSRTRTRWLAAKLGLTGLAAMVAAGLLSLAVTWWSSPIDQAIAANDKPLPPGLLIFPRLSPEIFDSRGVAPLGYAAFAFVLGVTIGAMVRRTVPAMAIVLVVFAVTQIVMSVEVRPHLMSPERLTTTITGENVTRMGADGSLSVAVDRPGAWSTTQRTVNASGQVARPPSWVVDCPPTGQESRDCFGRLTRLGYRQEVTYQPAGRFWAFQWAETAIYLALTCLSAGLCAWWVRHRLP